MTPLDYKTRTLANKGWSMTGSGDLVRHLPDTPYSILIRIVNCAPLNAPDDFYAVHELWRDGDLYVAEIGRQSVAAVAESPDGSPVMPREWRDKIYALIGRHPNEPKRPICARQKSRDL